MYVIEAIRHHLVGMAWHGILEAPCVLLSGESEAKSRIYNFVYNSVFYLLKIPVYFSQRVCSFIDITLRSGPAMPVHAQFKVRRVS